jgi:hypothetical protein
VDLPTLGRPTTASLITPSGSSDAVGFLVFAAARQGGQHLFHQGFDALIVGGGDDMQTVQTQGVELGAEQIRIAVFALVDHQMQHFTGAAQLVGDLFISGSQPAASVHQQQHGVGLLNRSPCLLLHHPRQTLIVVGQAAGIDDDIGMWATLADAVLAVAGQARQIRDQRVAGAGEGIEQGGFADVGSAY